MSLKRVLTLGLTTLGFYLFDAWVFEPFSEKIARFLQKRRSYDAGVNKFLGFGVAYPACDEKGRHGDYSCRNMSCNYGKVRYFLDLIRASKSTLDICIYVITEGLVGQEIIRAKSRGVKVRVIADCDFAMSPESQIHDFKKAGIPVRMKMSPDEFHHKFLVLDSKILVTGSMNFTSTGLFANMEHMLITSNSELTAMYVNGFDALWKEFEAGSMFPKTGYVKHTNKLS